MHQVQMIFPGGLWEQELLPYELTDLSYRYYFFNGKIRVSKYIRTLKAPLISARTEKHIFVFAVGPAQKLDELLSIIAGPAAIDD